MNRPIVTGAPGTAATPFDAGLRRHMIGIYNHMGIGLVITGLVAALIASSPALYQPIFGTPLK